MKSSVTSATDRRFRIGLAISLGSLLLIGVGLFAVVSAITGSDVKLPSQGNIQDIVGKDSAGTDNGGVAVQPTPFPTGPKPTRVSIPRIYVDAPVIQLGLEPGSDIPAVPDRGDQVAWYDFNPVPGIGYNAVFSGHVDWQTAAHSPIPGVFYRLRELQIGDEITVTLEDGQTLAYRVTGNVAVAWDDPDIVKAMKPGQKDVITILTCGGSWVPNSRQENGGNYSHRIVVRAERVINAAG